MSEMVERVEAAIRLAKAAGKTGDLVARAAIEAMRNPTEGMTRQYLGQHRETFICHWQNGIDAALK